MPVLYGTRAKADKSNSLDTREFLSEHWKDRNMHLRLHPVASRKRRMNDAQASAVFFGSAGRHKFSVYGCVGGGDMHPLWIMTIC